MPLYLPLIVKNAWRNRCDPKNMFARFAMQPDRLQED